MNFLHNRMFKFSLILWICVLVCEKTYADGNGSCAGSPNCSLFSGQTDGIVTLQDLQQKVQSKHWIMIYYSDFTNHQGYGKCNYRWNAPNQENNVHRELMCYNSDRNNCEDFRRTVKRTINNCDTARVDNVMNSTFDGVFYIQDLDQCIWYESCYEYNDANQCTTRYLDLLVSKSRYPDSTKSELSLQGLPWHMIASDLKNHFDMNFSDERMMFSWDGPECGFDGKVIEVSSASRVWLNAPVVLTISILTFSL